MTRDGTLIILYEVAQVDMLEHLEREYPGAPFVALDREVEYALEARGRVYVSGRELRSPAQLERMQQVEQTVRDFFSSEALQFFSYRNILLGPLYSFCLREYLNRIAYFADIFANLAMARAAAHWVVCAPAGPAPRHGGPLARLMHTGVIRAAQAVAPARGITVAVVGESAAPRAAAWRVQLRWALLDPMLALMGAALGAVRKPLPLRLIIADHWRNTRTWAQYLPEAEMFFVERNDLQRIPRALVWRHRMQFGSLEYFAGSAQERRSAATKLQARWGSARPALHIADATAATVVPDAFEEILRGIEQTLARIDGAYRLLGRYRPNAIVLRASVSGQTHYGVLALVAQALEVPCIELQHGLEYLGAGSISGDHAAQYLALYGPRIAHEFERRGYRAERLQSVGSPRFDSYAHLRAGPRDSVLCIGPDVYVESNLDTYDCEDYFQTMFAALPPEAALTLKLRGQVRARFFGEVLHRAANGRAYQVETRMLPQVLEEEKHGILVSCYSTSILEGMLCGLPAILLAGSPIERGVGHYHFDDYVAAGALAFAESAHDLSQALGQLQNKDTYAAQVAKARAFVHENFCFDGQSAERFAELIRTLGKRKSPNH